MNLEKAKEIAGGILDTAQALFKRDGHLYTVLFSIDEDERITPVSVSEKDQDNMDYIVDLMKNLASVPETVTIIALVEAVFNYFDKDKAVYKNVKNTPGAENSLMAIAHVRNGQSSMRQIIFVKDEDQVMFAGEPWDDREYDGALGKNPFKN